MNKAFLIAQASVLSDINKAWTEDENSEKLEKILALNNVDVIVLDYDNKTVVKAPKLTKY